MCYACGKALKYGEKPGFNEICPTCGADTHVCRMCRFFAPGLHWDCREIVDEQVVDKARRNHCEYFSVAETFFSAHPQESGSDKKTDAQRRFNALFGD